MKTFLRGNTRQTSTLHLNEVFSNSIGITTLNKRHGCQTWFLHFIRLPLLMWPAIIEDLFPKSNKFSSSDVVQGDIRETDGFNLRNAKRAVVGEQYGGYGTRLRGQIISRFDNVPWPVRFSNLFDVWLFPVEVSQEPCVQPQSKKFVRVEVYNHLRSCSYPCRYVSPCDGGFCDETWVMQLKRRTSPSRHFVSQVILTHTNGK